LCIFYFSPGTILTSIIFFTIRGVQNKRNPDINKLWTDQNLIIDGQVRWKNVVGYACFACCYFCIQNLAFLTIFFASKADINVGLITTIWSVNPLFMAIMDSIFFSQKLQYFHVIGMISIVACTVVLSLSGVIFPKDADIEVP